MIHVKKKKKSFNTVQVPSILREMEGSGVMCSGGVSHCLTSVGLILIVQGCVLFLSFLFFPIIGSYAKYECGLCNYF